MEIMERDLKKNGRMYEQSIELHMNNQPNILVIKKKNNQTYCVQAPWNIHKLLNDSRDWNMETMVILPPLVNNRELIVS